MTLPINCQELFFIKNEHSTIYVIYTCIARESEQSVKNTYQHSRTLCTYCIVRAIKCHWEVVSGVGCTLGKETHPQYLELYAYDPTLCNFYVTVSHSAHLYVKEYGVPPGSEVDWLHQ